MFLFASAAADLRRGQSVLITSTAGDSYTVRKGLLGRIVGAIAIRLFISDSRG